MEGLTAQFHWPVICNPPPKCTNNPPENHEPKREWFLTSLIKKKRGSKFYFPLSREGKQNHGNWGLPYLGSVRARPTVFHPSYFFSPTPPGMVTSSYIDLFSPSISCGGSRHPSPAVALNLTANWYDLLSYPTSLTISPTLTWCSHNSRKMDTDFRLTAIILDNLPKITTSKH